MTIEKHRKHRPLENVDGILFLTEESNIDITVIPKRKIDIEAKKKVELTAIDVVTIHYKNNGFDVNDCQKDNCGYDLYADKGV